MEQKAEVKSEKYVEFFKSVEISFFAIDETLLNDIYRGVLVGLHCSRGVFQARKRTK